MLQLFKEQFSGKYDGVTPPTMLPIGAISDGANVRKISQVGGWKVRKGCALNNTTAAESGGTFKSLHQYTHPRNADYHLIGQINSKLIDTTNDPPNAGTTFGTTILTTDVGTTAGFSAVVGENWFYADGNSPVTWGGDNPSCIGFLSYDASETAYNDYTRDVTDGRTETEAIVVGAATDELYVGLPEIGEQLTLDLGATVNSNAVAMTLKSWVNGAWADRTVTDGTETGGDTTLAQDGNLTWSRNATDTMSILGGIMAYWYQITWSGALSNSVDVISCTAKFDAGAMTNKWNGMASWPTGCRFYDQSLGDFDEHLGDVTNESTSMYIDVSAATTSDFIYIKTPERAAGFGIGIPVDYKNTDNAQIDGLEYWNGAGWTSGTGIVDGTLAGTEGFAQTGWVTFSFVKDYAANAAKMRTWEWDRTPGFWYRISWDVAWSANVRVYMVTYASAPETLPDYDGCIQFKNRLFLWGDPEYPNRLRFSAKGKPDCLSGDDSGYTDVFGDASVINGATRFYNELVVFKQNSVWLLEGNGPENFGILQIADHTGLASPQTVKTVEAGFPAMHKDEDLSIVIWEDTDGVYILDGRKPKKVSGPVDHYFNPEHSTCITAATIRSLSAFADTTNNEYHLLLPAVELVYNYVTDEWYPPWDRKIVLTCGTELKDANGRDYTYGGTGSGFVVRLETDTSDKTTANADEAINHYIKSRAFCADPKQAATFYFTMRRLWGEFKAQTAGDIVVYTHKDQITTGVSQAVPAAMSLINSGYSLVVPHLDMSIENCMAMVVRFGADTIDHEMWLYSMMYEIEVRGLSGVE